MDVEGFWQVVERARMAAGPAADRARQEGQPGAVADALIAELTGLPLREIAAFEQTFREVLGRADTWDTCAACWVIEYGFLSDDGFCDFRAGLVGLGRHAFEAAVAGPDSLADHPAVLQIAASTGHGFWIGDERLLFAASEAYERVTNDSDAFWDAVTAVEAGVHRQGTGLEPVEKRWDLRDGQEWRDRLPRLTALFLAQRLPSPHRKRGIATF